MRCENKACRKEAIRLFPIKSFSKRIDLCQDCYAIYIDMVRQVFETVGSMEDSDVEALKGYDQTSSPENYPQP